LIRALTDEQRRRAILSADLPRRLFTAAFRDNFEMRYEGIPHGELGSSQQDALLELVEVHVGRQRPDQARHKMAEVKRHLENTYFAWMGGVEDDSVFYYRVHSPVILIEFDHERGIAFPVEKPYEDHIHLVVRTPNGNDYGKDLLRQHYAQSHRLSIRRQQKTSAKVGFLERRRAARENTRVRDSSLGSTKQLLA
jgi:hypothetical protein